ncbi:hypothetical protein L9F63_002627, partial [Diploptera punctata]
DGCVDDIFSHKMAVQKLTKKSQTSSTSFTVWEKIYIQKSEKKKLMNFEIP